ncbi:MAG TPA: PAS domain-containing protein, partial [Usitatibacter sp.]|nr:PAS domain-containing protein [Usitatibacter sp.]
MSAVAPERLDFDLIREAFDFTSVGLIVSTLDGKVREVNRAFCEMTGYARNEVEGGSFHTFVHPEDAAWTEDHLRSIRAGGPAYASADKRFVRKNGSELWVRCSLAVGRDPQGQPRF